MRHGLIGNIQRYSLHDGPGIRTTVFFKGCPLDCAWCHNPENRSAQPELTHDASRCLACGACAAACPQGRSAPDVAAPPCTACGRCAEACPTEARRRIGRWMDVGQLLAEILKDRLFFDDSGGGVTFSGGEPLAQPDFLLEMLQACRERGVSTALDTCGQARWPTLLAAARQANLVLYDLKLLDARRHRQATGVDNGLILENLAGLARAGVNLWLRIPVVPGVNDDDEELAGMARLAQRLGLHQVQLLPYHPTAKAKYERLGRAYVLGDLARPSAERLEAALAHFLARGLTARIGG